MSLNRPGPSLAARHEAMARNYRSRARLLFGQYGDLDSAGALLYESAKQCINAVANQNGINPGPIRAKMQFLVSIADRDSATLDLIRHWEGAGALHIHADRGHLARQDFLEAWTSAQAFINQMLLVYRAPE